MFIHDLTASHHLCWEGPVHIRIARQASTSVSSPLIALDILKNHWGENVRTAHYQTAIDACLKATQGCGSLSAAREAFIIATQHLAVSADGLSEAPSTTIINQSTLQHSKTPSDHLARAREQTHLR